MRERLLYPVRAVTTIVLGLLAIAVFVGLPIFLAAAAIGALVAGRWIVGPALLVAATLAYLLIHRVAFPRFMKWEWRGQGGAH